MTAKTCHESELDDLFPTPALPPSVLCPQQYPGSSPEAVAALRHVMKDSHTKHHMFFGGQRYRNHITYRALALYASGASGALIEHFYEQDKIRLLPAIEPPEVITEVNFIEHLGDDNYYAAYVAFFVKSIKKNGVSATLEKYIFSKKYNFIEGRDASTQPVMLIHFFVGVFHSVIHVGYGTEFGIPGLVAQGLAMASSQKSLGLVFLPSSLFEHGSMTAVEGATTRLDRKTSIPSKLDLLRINHAFSILVKITQDSQFAPKEREKYMNDFKGLLRAHDSDVWRHTEQWTIDVSQPGEIERKMEECIWTGTILYAIGGWSREKGFTANIFFMHFVTSSMFLPSLLSYLSQDSRVILLRAYFTTILGWWISRCGPPLDVQGFLDATASFRAPEGEVTPTANPFLDIVQAAIVHPDDHMLKIQRTFAHFSSLYGARPKGYFKGTELEGAEELDGSLFLRAAGLTHEYMNQGTGSWSESFETY